MGILLRYVFKNITEKKLRSALIIACICLSTALFFASQSVTGIILDIETERAHSRAGSARWRLSAMNNPEAEPFFDPSILDIEDTNLDGFAAVVEGFGYITDSKGHFEYFSALGMTSQDFQWQYVPGIAHGVVPEHFSGNQIIMSEANAARLGLAVGDHFDARIHEKPVSLEVVALVESRGLFIDESILYTVIIPFDTMSDLFETDGKANALYYSVSDPAKTSVINAQIEKTYPDLNVQGAVLEDEVAQSVSNATLPFKLVSIFSILVSVFIIYTSFRIISLERLPVIGTFRSVGTTRGTMTRLFAAESILYGLIGGTLGCIAGIPIVRQIMALSEVSWIRNARHDIQFSISSFVIAIILAIVIAFASAIIPIITVSRRSLRALVLGEHKAPKRRSVLVFVLGLTLLSISVLGRYFIPSGDLYAIVGSSVLMGGVLFSIVLILPTLLHITGQLFGILFVRLGLGTLSIAAKGLQDNQSLRNNTILTTLGVSCLCFIFMLNNSLSAALQTVYDETTYDLYLVYKNADISTVDMLSSDEVITRASGAYLVSGVTVDGSTENINSFKGVDPKTYFDFWEYDFLEDRSAAINSLNQGRNVLLTDKLMQSLDLQIGDTILFYYNDSPYSYIITGSFYSGWSAKTALISEEHFVTDFQVSSYSEIYLHVTGDHDEAAEHLKSKHAQYIHYVNTKQGLIDASEEGVTSVFSVLRQFSQATMALSVFGIANNLIIAFIQRKRSLAIMRSIGTQISQIRAMLMTESFLCGAIAGLIGALGAALMLGIIPGLMAVLVVPMTPVYDMNAFVVFSLFGLALMVTSSIVPSFKASRIPLIEAIKYE